MPPERAVYFWHMTLLSHIPAPAASAWTVILHLNSGKQVILLNCNKSLLESIKANYGVDRKVYLGSEEIGLILNLRNIETIEIRSLQPGQRVDTVGHFFGVNMAGINAL